VVTGVSHTYDQILRTWLKSIRVSRVATDDADRAMRLQAIEKGNRLSWASDEINDAVYDDAPATGWQMVVGLIGVARDDDALSWIGAGPLENFIGKHGIAWIDVIERDAANDPQIRRALRSSWQGGTPPDIFRRIKRAAGETA